MKTRHEGRSPAISGIVKVSILCVSVIALSGCPSTESLYRQAYTHYLWEEEAEALALLDRILEKDDSYAQAYILESLIFQKRGESDKALVLLEKASQKAPGSAVVRFNLGNLYFQRRKYEDARTAYRAAIERDPSLSEAHLNLANTLMVLKQYPDALKEYETFLTMAVKEYPEVKRLVELLRVEFGGRTGE
ncbi:MAG TPA: tetratricopeptide repeat protein [Spirochaetia bacterium]|nr:tetratricopeptide repeat protein [Spirochaetia bacterium]